MGQGRSQQSDTALIYTAALSLKHPRGQVSIETPAKHQHTERAADPGLRCRALCAWEKAPGIAASREKPLL